MHSNNDNTPKNLTHNQVNERLVFLPANNANAQYPLQIEFCCGYEASG
jgi:hypothetical protein